MFVVPDRLALAPRRQIALTLEIATRGREPAVTVETLVRSLELDGLEKVLDSLLESDWPGKTSDHDSNGNG